MWPELTLKCFHHQAPVFINTIFAYTRKFLETELSVWTIFSDLLSFIFNEIVPVLTRWPLNWSINFPFLVFFVTKNALEKLHYRQVGGQVNLKFGGSTRRNLRSINRQA